MVRVAVCQLEGRPLSAAAEALAACRSLIAECGRIGADIAVLPEGSYPAYVLGSAEAARRVTAAGPEPLEAFGAMARDHALTLVAGLVVDAPTGLHNVAVTFGPDGRVLAQTAKRFLWHFDRRWFVAGDTSIAVDTPAGRTGALVCADARLPEIARTLAVDGAGLVCDPTAWVTSTPGTPSNIQPEYLVAARCIENGIVMACASKSGFEGEFVAYAGRSMIVDSDGTVLAEAPTRGDTVIHADVDLEGLPAPPVARHPAMYGDLVVPPEVMAPLTSRVRLAAAGCDWSPAPESVAGIAAQDVDLVVVPAGVDPEAVARDSEAWVAGEDGDGTGVLASPDGLVERFAVVHRGEPPSQLPPPVAGPNGNVVVLPHPDVLVPEQSRIAALRGAQVLAVPSHDVPLPVLRARAAENRVFVVAAGSSSVVVAPSGAVIAEAPAGVPFVCAADAWLAETSVKEMAPGSDVFANRQPAAYRGLIEPS